MIKRMKHAHGGAPAIAVRAAFHHFAQPKLVLCLQLYGSEHHYLVRRLENQRPAFPFAHYRLKVKRLPTQHRGGHHHTRGHLLAYHARPPASHTTALAEARIISATQTADNGNFAFFLRAAVEGTSAAENLSNTGAAAVPGKL